MTDFQNEPNTAQTHSAELGAAAAKDLAVAKMDYTGITNVPGDAVRWNASLNRWEKWDDVGVAWVELATSYSISVSNANNLNNQTPGFYLARGNHTGTQPLTTISDAGTAAAQDMASDGGPVAELGHANVFTNRAQMIKAPNPFLRLVSTNVVDANWQLTAPNGFFQLDDRDDAGLFVRAAILRDIANDGGFAFLGAADMGTNTLNVPDIFRNGSRVLARADKATQAQAEAGTDDTKWMSALGTAQSAQVNSPVKAWVNFDGTGTVAIRESFNVSSITDNGTGDYTVNFATALPDTNYVIGGSSGGAGGSGTSGGVAVAVPSSGTPIKSTTAVQIATFVAAVGSADRPENSVIIIR